MTSVSVVIPCYNYGHFLADAVGSVLDDQEGVDVRVLVIDDASTDGSADVAREIAAREPRVEVLVHNANRGHLATYNEGLLGWADGEYSVLMSADDRLTPGALARATALLDAHPTVGFAYGYARHFKDGDALPAARKRSAGWSVWPGHSWLERRFRQGWTGIASPEVVVRTSLQRRVGGYDARLPHMGDMEMWVRLAANGDVGYVRGCDQAFYRRHSENMSSGYFPMQGLFERRLAFESILERYPDLPNSDHLSDLIHRRLAWEALVVASRVYDRRRTADVPVDALVAFALDCWPSATQLAVYKGLKARQRVGPTVMPYLQPLVFAPLARKIVWWRWSHSWKTQGL